MVFLKCLLILPALFASVQCAAPIYCSVVGEAFADPNNNNQVYPGYNFASSFLQIFDWMRSPCDGLVLAVLVAPSTEPSSFYLGVFEFFPLRDIAYYRLKNYLRVDVPIGDGKTMQRVVLPEKSMPIAVGDTFGIFYDNYKTPQSKVAIRYKDMFDDNGGSRYPTYVGTIGLPMITKLEWYRIGAELSFVPTGRAPTLMVSVGAKPSTTPGLLLSCGDLPPVVPNAYVTWQSWEEKSLIRDIAEYSCMPGYRLRMGKYFRVTCQENANWSELPECLIDDGTLEGTIEDCGLPPTVEDAIMDLRYALRSGRPGDVVPYTCSPGYVLVGNGYVTCSVDKTWQVRFRCVKLA